MHILPQLKSNKTHDLPFFSPPPPGPGQSQPLWPPCAPAPVVKTPHNVCFSFSAQYKGSQGADPGSAHSPPMRPCKTCPGPSLPSLHPLLHPLAHSAVPQGPPHCSPALQELPFTQAVKSSAQMSPALLPTLAQTSACIKSWIRSCPFLKPPSSIIQHTSPSHPTEAP